MPAKINIFGSEAEINDGIWASENKIVQQFLEVATATFEATPDMGDVDVAAAEYVVGNYGGKITERKPETFDPKVVY